MIKNICVVVNNRANYARVKSILKEFKSSSNFNLQLVMGASSLLEKYGDLEKIIKKDKFKITDKFVTLVEKQIKESPHLYFWTHDRFKHKDKAPI